MSLAHDPSTQAWLDQEDAHTAQIIRTYGTYIQYVSGDDRHRQPPFAYTIGLFGIGHAELLVVGAGQATAANVLNHVSGQIREGRSLVSGELLTFEHWAHRVVVEAVPNPGEIAFAANRFYQRPDEYSVALLQLTYDDRGGRFPWEEGYDNPDWVQPRPGDFRA